ncbi:class I SAM-dependent methyltransferase [Maioricimonas sp. JC845]|uniref:class I SAM-dependent methyltransferase n=1 Tax=Maioricimonas sp. JC845 TaxID=3232138 RepID=UPI00345803B5
MAHSKPSLTSAFSDAAAVARYAEGPPRTVPGFADMHRMTTLLLAERVPENGRVLVVGAGGGLELLEFARRHPGWNFDGVDPSAEMIQLAAKTLGEFAERARLHHGFVNDAPEGPFDAATCLLTMHFVGEEERRRMVAEVHRRLRPGSPFVLVHLSFPQSDTERSTWLARYAEYAVSSGIAREDALRAVAAIDSQLSILTPGQDEAILCEAGFSNVSLFYAGFTFRGWVAYA